MGGTKMGVKNVIIAYDTRDNDLPVIVGDYQEVADYFGMSEVGLRSTMCRKALVQFRYEVVVVGKENDLLEGGD
jgi:hypothetical protein